MAKTKTTIPNYGTVTRKGIQYYRTRITDADGKRVDLYAPTCEELYEKETKARKQVEDTIYRRKNPTVAEYCESWLEMQSAKVSSATIRGYSFTMKKYIIQPLGDMYMSDVTTDDIRLALIPVSKKSTAVYSDNGRKRKMTPIFELKNGATFWKMAQNPRNIRLFEL